MDYEERTAVQSDGDFLAAIRVQAMKESLEAVGRFNPDTARKRFLDTFDPSETTLIVVNSETIGFYAVQKKDDHLYLAHLYLLPKYQGFGIGGKVVSSIKRNAKKYNFTVKVGALGGSKSNDFYLRNGFHKTHEEEWDLYYETTL